MEDDGQVYTHVGTSCSSSTVTSQFFEEGAHAMSVRVDKFGPMGFGVVTPNFAEGFVGRDADSWGLWNKASLTGNNETRPDWFEDFKEGDLITVEFNLESREVFCAINGQFLGERKSVFELPSGPIAFAASLWGADLQFTVVPSRKGGKVQGAFIKVRSGSPRLEASSRFKSVVDAVSRVHFTPRPGEAGVKIETPRRVAFDTIVESTPGGSRFETLVPKKALHVVIVGVTGLRASSRGTDSNPDPYCVVSVQGRGIQGKPRVQFQTPVVKDSRDPVWNFEGSIVDYSPGDALELGIYDRDPLRKDELLGQAALAPGALMEASQKGFNGNLVLSNAGGSVDARLSLTVEPVYTGTAGPVWSGFGTFTLCKEGEEDQFKDKARFLSTAEADGVRAAVDGLSKGTLQASEEFVVVLSKKRHTYYVIHRSGHRIEAMSQLGIKNEDLAEEDTPRVSMTSRRCDEASADVPESEDSLEKKLFRDAEVVTFQELLELRFLQLRRKKITTAPKRLGDLINLHLLDMSFNDLLVLPAIGKLQALETLSLSSNKLVALPDSMCKLLALRRLDLRENNLTELPASFGQLVKLYRLDLLHNKLQALPESFGQLQALHWLDLCGNQLAKLPESFCDLKALRDLDLKQNKLTELPRDFGHLAGLETLNLSQNLLVSLPDSFVQLTGLRTSDLQGNELQTLPEGLGQLTLPWGLHLGGNRLVYSLAKLLPNKCWTPSQSGVPVDGADDRRRVEFSSCCFGRPGHGGDSEESPLVNAAMMPPPLSRNSSPTLEQHSSAAQDAAEPKEGAPAPEATAAAGDGAVQGA